MYDLDGEGIVAIEQYEILLWMEWGKCGGKFANDLRQWKRKSWRVWMQIPLNDGENTVKKSLRTIVGKCGGGVVYLWGQIRDNRAFRTEI